VQGDIYIWHKATMVGLSKTRPLLSEAEGNRAVSWPASALKEIFINHM
jgi:hypothetical protein